MMFINVTIRVGDIKRPSVGMLWFLFGLSTYLLSLDGITWTKSYISIESILNMRPRFFELLYKAMQDDPDVWALTGDLGYGGFDKIRQMFPERFINVGAAEQSMLDIAVGLALEGKKPFCYSITPFLLYRPFETIRTYIDHEQIPVRLCGSGRDKDYEHDGYSHDATDVTVIMGTLPNIKQHWPEDIEELELMFQQMLLVDKPHFISLKKGGK